MQNNVVIFLWNTFTNRIVYMSDKVRALSGFEPAAYLADNGLEFSLSCLHPNQAKAILMMQQLFINGFMEQARGVGSDKVVMNISYLYRNADGKYTQVLQRGAGG